MLSTFLFLIFFTLYMWLYYKPNCTSSQHRHYGSAAPVQIIDKRTPISEHSLSVIAEEKLTVRTEPPAVRDTPPKPKLVEAGEDTLIQTSELGLDADTEFEPALTEEEAIALAVETTLAKDTMTETSRGELEDSVPETLMRPKPPDPELVEAAVRDAEEKFEDFSPPEFVNDESRVRV